MASKFIDVLKIFQFNIILKNIFSFKAISNLKTKTISQESTCLQGFGTINSSSNTDLEGANLEVMSSQHF